MQNNTMITKKGMDLLNYLHTGAGMEIVRAEIGDGKFESSAEIRNATSLKSPRMEVGVKPTVTMNRDGTATITLVIPSAEDEGFFASEIGIYANDPRYGEILYAVMSSNDFPNYIFPKSDLEIALTIGLMVIIGNVANITVNIDNSLIYVTHPELQDLAGHNWSGITVQKLYEMLLQQNLDLMSITGRLLAPANAVTFKAMFTEFDESEQVYGVFDKANRRLKF